jgi:hypothetical protein
VEGRERGIVSRGEPGVVGKAPRGESEGKSVGEEFLRRYVEGRARGIVSRGKLPRVG